MNFSPVFSEIFTLVKKEISSFLFICLFLPLLIPNQIITIFILPIFLTISLFYLVRYKAPIFTREFLIFLKQNFFKLFLGHLTIYAIIAAFSIAFLMLLAAIRYSDLLLIIAVPILLISIIIIVMRLSLVHFYLLDGLPLLSALRTSYNHPQRLIIYKIMTITFLLVMFLSFMKLYLLGFIIELFSKLLLIQIFFSSNKI